MKVETTRKEQTLKMFKSFIRKSDVSSGTKKISTRHVSAT